MTNIAEKGLIHWEKWGHCNAVVNTKTDQAKIAQSLCLDHEQNKVARIRVFP